MAGVRNRTIALLIAALVLSVGCSPQEEPTTPAAQLGTAPPEEATPTAAAAPTESEAPDPYAIPADPADIDKVYVERVLEELSVSIADAARIVARRNAVTDEARQALAATHRGRALPGIIGAFSAALEQGRGARVFSPEATPASIKVKKIVHATRTCVFTLVIQDPSGLATQEIEPFPTYYQLGVKRSGDDPQGKNPTPWMIVADGEPLAGGKEYADPCR